MFLFQDITQIEAIRRLVPANIEMYLIRMAMVLLQKQYKGQQLSQQNDAEKQQAPESDCLQSGSRSSQKKEEEILWIETKVCKLFKKGELVNLNQQRKMPSKHT